MSKEPGAFRPHLVADGGHVHVGLAICIERMLESLDGTAVWVSGRQLLFNQAEGSCSLQFFSMSEEEALLRTGLDVPRLLIT